MSKMRGNRNAQKPPALRKSVQFSVRVTPPQAQAWRKAAGKRGVSEWIVAVAEAKAGHPDEVNPATLCRNWRRGCNGVTDGPMPDGKLSLCDECAAK